MHVYLAADHAGFELKQELLAFIQDELGYAATDCGAFVFDETDDYPDLIREAAAKVSTHPDERAIIIGASGEGEAIVANKFPGVRAVVYYGAPSTSQTDASGTTLDLISSTRVHNDANVLSLGARFLTSEDAKDAVRLWLQTEFPGEERHMRRIEKIKEIESSVE